MLRIWKYSLRLAFKDEHNNPIDYRHLNPNAMKTHGQFTSWLIYATD